MSVLDVDSAAILLKLETVQSALRGTTHGVREQLSCFKVYLLFIRVKTRVVLNYTALHTRLRKPH